MMTDKQFLNGDEVQEGDGAEDWIDASVETDTDNTVHVGVDESDVLDGLEIGI